jgi:hypothetical protein
MPLASAMTRCSKRRWNWNASLLEDEYFVERKLYPNVDVYSGLIMRVIDIPPSMFTPLFAVARTVGWIAHWIEMLIDPEPRIVRPRQLYVGATERDCVDCDARVEHSGQRCSPQRRKPRSSSDLCSRCVLARVAAFVILP